MKATELMIGDWVYSDYHRTHAKVHALTQENLWIDIRIFSEPKMKYEEVKPIPLTEEILKKNGFKFHSGEKNMYGITTSPYYARRGLPHIYCDGNPFAIWFEEEVIIRYVHELQHVMRICRTKKDIQL